jgi:hypothetical protein
MSEVTRSAQATGGAAAARVAHARRTLPNGWWGMLLLVAAETTLFGTLRGRDLAARGDRGTQRHAAAPADGGARRDDRADARGRTSGARRP